MAIKIKTVLAITLTVCVMNSCQQEKKHIVNNNDRIPSKYIVYTQYIINPQDGECYGYIDSILYWKKHQSDILLVYTSELTGENIYSPYNIIILKEDGIIHVPCLKIYGIHELDGNVLSIEDSASLAGTITMGTHIFHFDKEIEHEYSYRIDSLKDDILVRKAMEFVKDNAKINDKIIED